MNLNPWLEPQQIRNDKENALHKLEIVQVDCHGVDFFGVEVVSDVA